MVHNGFFYAYTSLVDFSAVLSVTRSNVYNLIWILLTLVPNGQINNISAYRFQIISRSNVDPDLRRQMPSLCRDELMKQCKRNWAEVCLTRNPQTCLKYVLLNLCLKIRLHLWLSMPFVEKQYQILKKRRIKIKTFWQNTVRQEKSNCNKTTF